MTASIRLTEDGILVASASNAATSGRTSKRHSGILAEALTVSSFDADYASYLAVATRDKPVTVALAYAVSADETYVVSPGRPLLTLLSATEVPTSVTVTPETEGDRPDVEVSVYASTVPINPESQPFLLLNAGAGITEDEFLAGSVVSWRDTRTITLAPDEFEWSNLLLTPPTLIESDPDFAGKPSVDFSESGDGEFVYETANDIFAFLSGNAGDDGTDFTVMAILSVPDDALTASQYQGLWCILSDGADNGFSMMVDPAYRMYNSIPAAGETTIYADEFKEKPTVVIWDFDESTDTLRVYWQGRWHAAETFAGTTGGVPNVLRLGKAFTEGGTAGYLRGKIADFRVYNRRLSAAEKQAYIDMAVSEYGIDDTEVQGFPFISSTVHLFRANRGLAASSAIQWFDTRPEVAAGAGTCDFSDPGAAVAADRSLDPLFNNQYALNFDGTDFLFNTASGGTADHLCGPTPGFTLAIVYYASVNESNVALFSMSNYAAGTLNGTNVWQTSGGNGRLGYETDNGAGADVILTNGQSTPALTPRLVVLRGDGTDWDFTELNLATDEEYTLDGAYGAAESSSTTADIQLFAWADTTGMMTGKLAEWSSVATYITDAQLALLFEYAKERYGTA